MKIGKATRSYESWLRRHTRVIDADLRHKHAAMAADAFSFLRATFYRWVQLWPKVCKPLAGAHATPAVGDLHIENFGTWRDAEGRLAWGVNDFDEAWPLPYTNDLVRLATSAALAIRQDHLAFDRGEACEALIEGYRRSLEAGGKPFIIEEDHRWFAPLVDQQMRNPARFWRKLEELPDMETLPPRGAVKAIDALLPDVKLELRYCHRVAGLGSLGKQRVLALTHWAGGPVAREAKAIVPSACAWAGGKKDARSCYARVMSSAVRCEDPLFQVRGRWIVRRLSPECSRVELTGLPRPHDDVKLLHAMGWETANIHLGNPAARKKIARDVKRRRQGWLKRAADAILEATLEDWSEWKLRVERGTEE